MILACVGIYAQNFTSKIAPSHDLITLRGINQKRALFSAFFNGTELLAWIRTHLWCHAILLHGYEHILGEAFSPDFSPRIPDFSPFRPDFSPRE